MKATEVKINSSRHSLRLAIALACVLAASLLTTLSNYPTMRGSNAFLINIALSTSGPIAGWIMAFHDHKIQDALQLLLPTLIITLALMYFYYRSHSLTILILTSIWWWACGFLFTVAIWV